MHFKFLSRLGDHDVPTTTFKLNCLKFKRFKLTPSLTIVVNDLGFGGRHLAFLVLTAACDLPSHGPHVDHCFPSRPFACNF